MRGSLAILAALCVVVAAAEASSVRFVSIDEGQTTNGKDKKDKNGVSERSDSDVKKSFDDVVKKINDGDIQSEKTIKNVELDRSSADNGSDSAREATKKSAVPEKAKVQKRDVRRALDLLAKRAMKRDAKEVSQKIIQGLVYIVERMEKIPEQREALLAILNQFQLDIEKAYNDAINKLKVQPKLDVVSQRRKYIRANEIPSVVTALNQRNPMAIIPVLGKIVNAISSAASVAEIASSLTGRSNSLDMSSILELFEKLVTSSMQGESESIDY